MKPQIQPTAENNNVAKGVALKFVILLGVVSLFADMTYEGARSVTGPFLASLGASGTVVGFVAGFGELLGYGLRLVSGYFSDRSGKYWVITLFGYGLNLLVVPLLALAGSWEIAALLMMTERTGKAIRNPTRDAMLSHATKRIGRGWGFGLHEAMDQTGAMVGPLIFAAVLYFKGNYRTGFAILLVPAILALSLLLVAQRLYPRPRDLEIGSSKSEHGGVPRVFWLYMTAGVLVAAGYVDFPLIAYHFAKASIAPSGWIPLFYAFAMGMAAVSALVFGRLFDRKGISILVVAVLLSSFFAPLVFLGGFNLAWVGMALWGLGMGVQESIMRAAIADMVPINKRAGVYGIYDTGYGVFWFLGSALMGFLYDISLGSLIAFSIITQLSAIPLLLVVAKRLNRNQVR